MRRFIAFAVLSLFGGEALFAQSTFGFLKPYINVRNSTGKVITELNVTDADNSGWGKNLLDKPLGTGMPFKVTLQKTLGEARVYDFRLVGEDGAVYTKYGVDVKPLSALVFRETDYDKAGTAAAGASRQSSGKDAGGIPDQRNTIIPIAAKDTDEVRRKIIEAAQKYIGASYGWGAQSPPRAFDCSGLISQAYFEAAGVVIPRTSAQMLSQGIKKDEKSLRPGDIIVMDTMNAGRPTHVALYIDGQNTIQSLDGTSPPGVSLRGNPGLSQARVLGYVTFIGWQQGNKANYSPVGSTEFVFSVTADTGGIAARIADAVRMAVNSTSRFIFVNDTGRPGVFDYHFSREGGEADAEREHFTLEAGAKFESGLCLPKTPGRYTLELLQNGKRVFEKTFTVSR